MFRKTIKSQERRRHEYGKHHLHPPPCDKQLTQTEDYKSDHEHNAYRGQESRILDTLLRRNEIDSETGLLVWDKQELPVLKHNQYSQTTLERPGWVMLQNDG